MSPAPKGAPDQAAETAPGAASWALAAGLIIVCIWGANFAVQKALFQVQPLSWRRLMWMHQLVSGM